MANSQWNMGPYAWERSTPAELQDTQNMQHMQNLQNLQNMQNLQNLQNMHLGAYHMLPYAPIYSSPMPPGPTGYQPGILGAPHYAGSSFPLHPPQAPYNNPLVPHTHDIPGPSRMPMGPVPEQQAAKYTAQSFPNPSRMGRSDTRRIEVDSEDIYRSSKPRRVQSRPRIQEGYENEPARRAVPLTAKDLAENNASPSLLRSQRVREMPSTAYVESVPESPVRPISPVRRERVITVNRHDDSDSDSDSDAWHVSHGPKNIPEPPKKPVRLNRKDKYARRDRHGRLREIERAGERFGEPTRPLYGDDKIESSITINRHFDENGNLRYYTLWVESLAFLTLLRDVGKYELHTLNETGSYGFMEPFIDIFYRRDGLREFIKQVDLGSLNQYPSLNDKVTCAKIILDLVDVDFAATAEKFDLFRSADPPVVISYADLWMIYQPGSLVFAQREGKTSFALMIDSIKYSKSVYDVEAGGPNSQDPLIIHGWFLDFHTVNGVYDGKFGRRSYSLVIEPFEGERLISKLQFVPEAFFKDEETKNRLKMSGRRFWQLSGPSYREVPRLDKLGRSTLERDRIMVDSMTDPEYIEAKPQNYDDGIDSASNVAVTYGRSGGVPNWGNNVYSGRPPPVQTFSRSWFNEYDVIDPSSEPTELMLLLCPPNVHAFSLREKTWDTYRVADLEPVEFRENAWSRLVIDQEYKDVVQAMVNSHLRQSDKFDDLIPGKGGGVVILLHGPPGVGKTLTAESVAENSHKPLYMVTAGDLGTDPARLESKLSTIFELATRWDAILLLDEADVFLQDRDYENLTRNALVSIFLRTLEYFKGIMFLTSNRVGAFDQAFQSRIHITLGIPEFNEAVRKEVWAIFLDDLGQKRRDGSNPLLSLEECKALRREVLDSWSRELLNGRQIRNCVRSALALAQDKGEKVSAKHFNIVIQLGNTFTNYMNKLQKLESGELAQVKGDRLAEMRSLVVLSGQPNGHCETHEEVDV